MTTQTWTTKQLIALSNSLAIAQNNETSTQAANSQDQWTSERFIQMSNSFAQI